MPADPSQSAPFLSVTCHQESQLVKGSLGRQFLNQGSGLLALVRVLSYASPATLSTSRGGHPRHQERVS